MNIYLTKIVDKALNTLKDCFCVDFEDDDRGLISTNLGRIASYYYLSHLTVQHFKQNLNGKMDLEEVLGVLCDATEFDQLPVRHNEDHMNEDLAKNCPLESSNSRSMESPNTKTFLLLQAHFSRLTLPCSDYYTDLKSVLDQTIRILQVKKMGKNTCKHTAVKVNFYFFSCMFTFAADLFFSAVCLYFFFPRQ